MAVCTAKRWKEEHTETGSHKITAEHLRDMAPPSQVKSSLQWNIVFSINHILFV